MNKKRLRQTSLPEAKIYGAIEKAVLFYAVLCSLVRLPVSSIRSRVGLRVGQRKFDMTFLARILQKFRKSCDFRNLVELLPGFGLNVNKLIGKNASLPDRVEAGFVTLETFMNYLISSLIIIQLRNCTTLFTNRFGKNGISDKLMMMLSAGKGGYVTAAIAVLFVYIQLATLLLSGKYTHNRAVQ